MTLYNLRTDPSGFRVTKFDDDLEVESSYILSPILSYIPNAEGDAYACDCPAGIRPTCRHRQMLPTLLERLDTAWFLDHETQEWVDPTGQASENNVVIDPQDLSVAEIEGYELVCVNGHDRCYEGAFEGCPYCEKRYPADETIQLKPGLYAIPGDLHPGDKAKANEQIAEALDAKLPVTTFEQDQLTGHTSRLDEEADAACAPNRDEPVPFKRRV